MSETNKIANKIYAIRTKVYNSKSLDARDLKREVLEDLDNLLDVVEA